MTEHQSLRKDETEFMTQNREDLAPSTADNPVEPGYRKNWNPNEWYQETAIAEAYDKKRFSSLAGRTFDALEKRALLKAFGGLPKGSTIIDAPCGTGRLAETLLEAGYNVIGLDIAAPMLEVANRKLARFGDRFQSHVRDVRTLDPKEFQVDAVLCARVLMHFPLEEQVTFLRAVASLTEGPVVFNQSLSTPWHRARRSFKRLLGNQTPASYPLVNSEADQLIADAGLKKTGSVSVQPLVSEARFWSCE
jgi:2-polyprenyl-3-methyl-5-hydroxy-6-metoxy-1,4-benzoquinol methylase